MKDAIFLIFIWFTIPLTAQTNSYVPFPGSGAIWNVQSQGCCTSNCQGPPFPNPVLIDYYFSYYSNGDTTINALVYSKIFKSGSSHEHCTFGGALNNWSFYNDDYVGALRQDTSQRTVYFLETSSPSECLLYDFNLAIGDTVQGNCQWPTDCAVVTAIDSVLVGSSYRSRYHLSTNPPYALIEGIGSTSGLFDPLCPFEYFGNLECFSYLGQSLYLNSSTSCNNVSGIKYEIQEQSFTISPNPFTESARITLHHPVVHGTWELVDTFGKICAGQKFSGQIFFLERKALLPGIYFLCMRGDRHFYNASKIIIQ